MSENMPVKTFRKNWAGNHEYPTVPVRPASLEELSAIVVAAAEDRESGNPTVVRAVGSRHSFNAIADGDVMVDLSGLPERFEVSQDRLSVTVDGAMTYGRFAELAEPVGVALHNLASLPHISIAGAISTGTHGSGNKNGNLATAVVGLEIMDASGQVRVVTTEAELADRSVALGAAGLLTAVTLRVEPAYEVEQRVFDGVPWDAIRESFDEIFGSAYSVSAFTRWGADGGETDGIEQLWCKRRTDQVDNSGLILSLGGTPATEQRHPVKGVSAENCTDQLGRAGLWSTRLPHFRAEFAPSVGDEIQSEFFIARADAGAGIDALRRIADEISSALLASEIRTIAADELTFSPCFGRDSVAFHFTWKPDQAEADRAAAAVADALAPLEPRAHWGKVFAPDPELVGRYPGCAEAFASAADKLFINRWLSDIGTTETAAEPATERVEATSGPLIGNEQVPPLGLGTFGSDHVGPTDVAAAVSAAIDMGYRFIDCASVYGNEAEIGAVLAQALERGLRREELWISSKVWNDRHDDVSASLHKTLDDLGLDYLDLYLVHWPFPNHHPPHCDVDERNPEAVPYSHERFMATWRQMEALVAQGLVRYIGTSNMTISKLDRVLEDATIKPAVNEMELHPHFQQPELFDYLTARGITPIGFCPIGSPARPERDRTAADTSPTEDPVIVDIAQRHGVHPRSSV